MDAAGDGGEDFVGDGVKNSGEFADVRVLAEDGDGVTHLHVQSGDVKHAHVHADIAYGAGALSVHAETGAAAAQVPVQSVSIAGGDGKSS